MLESENLSLAFNVRTGITPHPKECYIEDIGTNHEILVINYARSCVEHLHYKALMKVGSSR